MSPTLGDLAAVVAPDGSTATVALHGGHVVSWRTADGRERLFLSDRATIAGGSAIRGGIPVCFPQFAARGPLPKHGFARTSTWSQAGPATFVLEVPVGAWPGWPHACALTLDVLLGPSTLTTVLRVVNSGDETFVFTGALHTYLACDDVSAVKVVGLDDRIVDGGGQVTGAIEFTDAAADVDLSVLEVGGPVNVEGLDRAFPSTMVAAQTGFPDVVVWNIGATSGASMGDLGEGQWREYVCVEAAVVGRPVSLAAGSTWTGSQTLTLL